MFINDYHLRSVRTHEPPTPPPPPKKKMASCFGKQYPRLWTGTRCIYPRGICLHTQVWALRVRKNKICAKWGFCACAPPTVAPHRSGMTSHDVRACRLGVKKLFTSFLTSCFFFHFFTVFKNELIAKRPDNMLSCYSPVITFHVRSTAIAVL